jgi:hypothetical protein
VVGAEEGRALRKRHLFESRRLLGCRQNGLPPKAIGVDLLLLPARVFAGSKKNFGRGPASSKISRSQGAREVFALRMSLASEQTPAGHIWGDRQIEQAKERRSHIGQYSVPYLKIVSVLGDINEMD